MVKAWKTLLWKEYRETYPVLLATFVFGVTITGLNLIFPSPGVEIPTIFSVFTSLYLLVVSAISYSREIDENRYPLLRRFPFSPRLLAGAKVGWIAISTAVLVAAFGVAALVIGLCGGWNVNETSLIDVAFLLFTGGEFFIWGLFWTTRTRRQIPAILLTLLCVFGIPLTMLLLYDRAVDSAVSWETSLDRLGELYASNGGVAFRFGILALLLYPTVRGLFDWFERQTRFDSRARYKPADDAAGAGASKIFTPERPVRSPFVTLIWQHFAEHEKTNQRLLAIIVGIIIALGVADYFLGSALGKWLPPITRAFFIVLTIYLTRVLAINTTRREETILTRLGVSPPLFFTSRLTAMALSLTVIALFPAVGAVWEWLLKSDQCVLFLYLYRMASKIDTPIFYLTLLLPAVWAGAFFRGRIIPVMAGFAGIAALINYFAFLSKFLYPLEDHSHLMMFEPKTSLGILWLPVGIAALSILAASYHRIRAILFERTGRRHAAVNLAILFGPALIFLFTVFPFLRMASFSLTPAEQAIIGELRIAAAPSGGEPVGTAETAAAFRSAQFDIIKKAKSFQPMIEIWKDVESELKDPNRTRFSAYGLSLAHEWYFYSRANQIAGELAPEELRRGIDFLETIPETRVSLRRQGIKLAKEMNARPFCRNADSPQIMTRLFERFFYKAYSTPEIAPTSVWPWENNLTRRILQKRTASFVDTAEYIEKTIYRDEEIFDQKKIIGVIAPVSLKRLFGCNIWVDIRNIFNWGMNWEIPRPYQIETARRMALAELAILLYYREKGDWPDSFAAVVEAGYLTTIPTVPGTMGKEEIQLTPRSEKKEGEYSVPFSVIVTPSDYFDGQYYPRNIFVLGGARDGVNNFAFKNKSIVSPTPILWCATRPESEYLLSVPLMDYPFVCVPSPMKLPPAEPAPERNSSDESKEKNQTEGKN